MLTRPRRQVGRSGRPLRERRPSRIGTCPLPFLCLSKRSLDLCAEWHGGQLRAHRPLEGVLVEHQEGFLVVELVEVLRVIRVRVDGFGDPRPLLGGHENRELAAVVAHDPDAAVVAFHHLPSQCQALQKPLPPRSDFCRARSERWPGRRNQQFMGRGANSVREKGGVVIHTLVTAEVPPILVKRHERRPRHSRPPYFEPRLGSEMAAARPRSPGTDRHPQRGSLSDGGPQQRVRACSPSACDDPSRMLPLQQGDVLSPVCRGQVSRRRQTWFAILDTKSP